MTAAGADSMSRRYYPAAFVGHDIYRQAAYGRLHPLMIPRVESVVDMIHALDWFEPGEYVTSPIASTDELEWFHAPDYVAALRTATNAGTVDFATRERFASIGSDVLGGTPGEFAEFLKRDYAKWSRVIKEANVKVE